MRRRLLARCLVAATIGASVGVTSIAQAQLATIVTIPHPARANGVRLPSQLPYWVNRQDCLVDDLLTFTMTLSGGFTAYTLEVWAGGSDCTPTASRIGTTATCWKVGAASPTTTPFSIAIRARDIVAHNLPSSLVPANNQGVKPGTLADCTDTSTTPPQDIILDFMLVTSASGAAQTSHFMYKSGIDIWGPAPPLDVAASAGETRLHVGWTRSTSPDIIRYDLYCDPPPGFVPDSGLSGLMPLNGFPPLPGLETFAPDATVGVGGSGGVTGSGGAGGFSFDAGAGGTTTTTDGSAPAAPTGPSCNSSSLLRPGQPIDNSYDVYKCGEAAGKQAASGTVDNLINNVQYTVAVVGVDAVLNQGVLSGQACASPEEVTDFFELYRQAGGSGGGGICSIGRPGRRPPVLGMLVGGIAAAWILRRRGRRQ
jgi:hypothetical protein